MNRKIVERGIEQELCSLRAKYAEGLTNAPKEHWAKLTVQYLCERFEIAARWNHYFLLNSVSKETLIDATEQHYEPYLENRFTEELKFAEDISEQWPPQDRAPFLDKTRLRLTGLKFHWKAEALMKVAESEQSRRASSSIPAQPSQAASPKPGKAHDIERNGNGEESEQSAEALKSEDSLVQEQRKLLLTAYKRECKTHGIALTYKMIANAASPRWNDRTYIKWWLSCDPRSTSVHDQQIRGVLSKKPHIPQR